MTNDAWNDPKTWITLCSMLVGICGLVFGLLSFRWNRAESRLEAISKIIQMLIRASQFLHHANSYRMKAEQLKLSFPDDEVKHAEAKQRINEFIEDYGKNLDQSLDQFRLGEAESASRSFRFPLSINTRLKGLIEALIEYSEAVQGGQFAQAEMKFAIFRDRHKAFSEYARGWRLADPLEWLEIRFKQISMKAEEPRSKYQLTDAEMKAVMDLVYRRASAQANNSFAVHPPKKLLANLQLLDSDRAIEELENEVFTVVLQDGTTKLFSFVELMVFVYQIITLALQHHEVSKMMSAMEPQGPVTVKVNMRFAIEDILKPEMVKLLLSKIEFSKVSSD